jgi:hypothetical protein
MKSLSLGIEALEIHESPAITAETGLATMIRDDAKKMNTSGSAAFLFIAVPLICWAVLTVKAFLSRFLD